MPEKERGAVTVFLSLAMVVFLAATLSLQEIMRIQLAYGTIASCMDGAGWHLLADYNRALAKRYELYALDETYNGYGVEELLTRAQDYMEYALQPELPGIARSGFLDPDIEDIVIEAQEYLTDETNQNLERQISDCVKTDGLRAGIDFLKQQLSEVTEQKQQSDSIREELKTRAKEEEEAKRNAAEAAEKTPPSPPQDESAAPPQDPRDGLISILSKGVLYYITDGDTSLGSESTLEAADSRSFLNLDGLIALMKKQSAGEIGGEIRAQAELISYLTNHFRNYVEDPNEDEKKNRCELEYLVCGKSSDADNLNHMAGKIIAFRFPMNFAVALGDGEMRGQALAGITGIPPVVTAVQYLLLAAWSYAETLLEMKGLLQGKKVAAVKRRSQWNLSLEQIGTGTGLREVENGMDYADYLRLFLALTERKDLMKRMLAVIEQNLQMDNPAFALEHCVCRFRLTGRSRIDERYSLLPGAALIGDWYEFEISVWQQY